MLFTTTIFKTILVKEIERNLVRKVHDLKNNLQVGGISAVNKRREELLDLMSVEAHELAIEIWDKQGDQTEGMETI